MLTFNEVLRELEAGKTVEMKFDHSNNLSSVHEITLDGGMIYDYCHDDYTTTLFTVKEFKYGFYSKVYECKFAELDEHIV